MIEKTEVKLKEFSWIGSAYEGCGAVVRHFYEPESILELIEIGRKLYSSGQDFRVIGHTSNLYFAPDAIIENIVSTRKLTNYTLKENSIECECGVHVMKFVKAMNCMGIAGYEGLIDLPGTIGAAIYGNSDAYGYSIVKQLISFDLLCCDGSIKTLTSDDINPELRSTDLKKEIIKGIILNACLRKDNDNPEQLKLKAEQFHQQKLKLISHTAHNLGTVYVRGGQPTILNRILTTLLYPYGYVMSILKGDKSSISYYIRDAINHIIGAKNLSAYLQGGMSIFVWRDERAHKMFPLYVKAHKLLYTENNFEIEFIGFKNQIQ